MAIIPDLSKPLDGAALRAQQVSKDAEIRLENIARKVLTVLIEEKVTTTEIGPVTTTLIKMVNGKFDAATVGKVMEL